MRKKTKKLFIRNGATVAALTVLGSESLTGIFANAAQVIRKLDDYKPNVIFDLGAAAETLR
jgi:hypothetical protein